MRNTAGNYCIYALGGDIDLRGGGRGGITSPKCGLITNQDLVVTGNANVDASLIGYVGSGPGGGTYPEAQPQKSLPVSDPCPTIPGCAYLTDLTVNHPGLLHTGCKPFPGPTPASARRILHAAQRFADAGARAVRARSGDVQRRHQRDGRDDLQRRYQRPHVQRQRQRHLTAPTTGPTAGMVFYQPPSNTAGFTKNGAAGTVNFNGGFYAPTSDMTFNGQLPSITLLVVNSIRMNGGGITVPATGLMHARRPRRARGVRTMGRNAARSLAACESGSALAEMAIVLPLLVLLLIALIEVGRYGNYTIRAGNAARAGVQYGAQNTITAADIDRDAERARRTTRRTPPGFTATASNYLQMRRRLHVDVRRDGLPGEPPHRVRAGGHDRGR